MCPTRWTARTAAIEAILKDYELLIETLEEVHQSTQDEYGMKAGGLQQGLEKFNMFFFAYGFAISYSAQQNSSH